MNKMFLFIFLFSNVLLASEIGLPIQLRLKSPSGSFPTETGVAVKIQVLSNTSNCILREENFSGINVTDGGLSVYLGSGFLGANDPSLTLFSVFDNSKSKAGLSCLDGAGNVISTGQSYTPNSYDSRQLRVLVNLSSGVVISTFPMKTVAYAVHSESVGGKSAADLINVNTTTFLSQTNLETLLANATKFNNLLNVANGSAPGGVVTSITAGIGLTGGTITSSGTLSLSNTTVSSGSYGSSLQVPTFTVDSQGRLTTAANVTITPTWASISGKPSTLTGYGISLVSSDVTTALGYAPLNPSMIPICSSSQYLTYNGSTDIVQPFVEVLFVFLGEFI